MLDGFANSVQDQLSDEELLMLSLVYSHFDAFAQEPSLETRHRLVQSIEHFDEFDALCDILCGIYNDRVSKQVTKVAFKAKLVGLLSYIESLFWDCLQRQSECAS